jgi:hypothetical protein
MKRRPRRNHTPAFADSACLFAPVRTVMARSAARSGPPFGGAPLGSIAENGRRSEAELRREFEAAQPRILGALLDAVAHGLRTVGFIHLGRGK